MNTFQKKPYNPNIKKIYPTIVAPIFEDDKNKLAQLFILIEQGNIAEVKKYILTTRAKLNAIYNDESVLHKVLMIDDTKMSESKKLDFIIYLVSNGALINAYNKYNITPLHLAVQKKYLSIVKYFIQKNANINSVTNENLTPLHYATLVNIDSCPSDYSPQNIIDIDEKNINYNKITNILVDAFKQNKDFQIANSTIDEADYVDGSLNPVGRYTFTGSKLIDSIKNSIEIVSLTNVIEKMPDVDKIISIYNNFLTNKIKDNKINIGNLNKENTIDEVMKSEINKLKKKITVNKNIESILKKSLKDYTLPSIKLNYEIELPNIIKKIDDLIKDELSRLFQYIVKVKAKENSGLPIANTSYNNFYLQNQQTEFNQEILKLGIDTIAQQIINGGTRVPQIQILLNAVVIAAGKKAGQTEYSYNYKDINIALADNEIDASYKPRYRIDINYNYFSYYFIFLEMYDALKRKSINKITPLEIHNLLYVLSVIHNYVSNKINVIDITNKILNEINDIIEELKETHNNLIIKCTTNIIIGDLVRNKPNVTLSTINLDKYNFNIYEPLKIEKYTEILLNPAIDQNYIAKFIDKNYIEYFIGFYLNQIRTTYFFYDQGYYKNALNKINNLIIDDNAKHKIVRECIYKMYDTLITDFVNNLTTYFIRKQFIDKLQPPSTTPGTVNLMNLINIYLPNKEYVFNLNTYTNNIINKIVNANNRNELDDNLLNMMYNNLQNGYDFKLIEDEDYDIYDDKNFNSDVITIEKINKYYPIFYSYNYDGQEINKECLIINYDLIEYLLKSGANINIKDQTGKTVIDYIVDGKMHYILNDKTEYIKKRLVKNNLHYIFEKIIKNELEHNNLFGYTNNKIKLLENYEKTFIDKLKNTEEIKNNIPLNIKYIFKIYLLLQNIYWFRMLNKDFFVDNTYIELFDIKYTSKNKLTFNNDWKKMISEIEFEIKLTSEKVIEKKISKLMKSTTIIEGMGYDNELLNQYSSIPSNLNIPYDRPYALNKNKKKILEKLKKKLVDISYNVINDTSLNYSNYFNNMENIKVDKSLLYFRKIFQNLVKDESSYNYYTYIWQLMNDFDKPYLIHLKMNDIYNKILQKPIINNIKKESYSAISLIKQQNNIKILDNNKIEEINTEISKLIKYMEPISKFIDGRMYEQELSSNPLLLFQIRTIIHILTTFIGSNMIMFIRRLLFFDYNNILDMSKTKDDINNEIDKQMEELKEYVLSDLLIDGKLSYDFIKLIKPFKITEYDLPNENSMEDIFEKIIQKLNFKEPMDDKIILNIRTKVLPYYQSLYKEATIQLLNFSDSYYRFIKNQYAGMLMINKCC
jgi:ankyrin repeat protein